MPISIGPNSDSSLQHITLNRSIDKVIEIEYGVILHYVLRNPVEEV
jgi:hypothetical protein